MTHSTARNRSQLESLWQQPAIERAILREKTFAQTTLQETIHQFGKDLLAFLTGAQQLRIWTKSTKQGVVWFAYDPMNDQRIGHASEAELRVWLESRQQ